MDGSSPKSLPKDRLFDPSRTPITDSSRALFADVLERLASAEQRVRRRRAADQRRHEMAVGALVCDLAHRYLTAPDGWLMVEMAKASLSAKRRRADFMTEQFPECVKALAASSMPVAELRMGRHTPFGGERSTLRAAQWLRDRIAELDLSVRDFTHALERSGEPIVLRGTKFAGKAKTLDLPDTGEVRRLRADMDEINSWLHEADLDWDGDDKVDLNDRLLRRMFNNASFECGGRLFGGFWQKTRSTARLEGLLIEGHRVVSVDFAQMSVHMAYGAMGMKPPPGDLYSVPGTGGSRNGVKQVLNALLATDKILSRFPKGTKALFPSGRKFADILEAIEQFHAPIAPLFGTSQALVQMNVESRVMVHTLLHLKRLEIVALPIHDCLLVPVDHRSIAKETMEATFEHFTGIRAATTVEYPSALSHLRTPQENV